MIVYLLPPIRFFLCLRRVYHGHRWLDSQRCRAAYATESVTLFIRGCGERRRPRLILFRGRLRKRRSFNCTTLGPVDMPIFRIVAREERLACTRLFLRRITSLGTPSYTNKVNAYRVIMGTYLHEIGISELFFALPSVPYQWLRDLALSCRSFSSAPLK